MGHLPPAPVRRRTHRTSPSGAKANVVQFNHMRIQLYEGRLPYSLYLILKEQYEKILNV
ncbi:MAG: hypothetical protein ACFFD2_02270 [Promethearchaeota archaeon]